MEGGQQGVGEVEVGLLNRARATFLAFEGPTWLLALAVYGAWGALVWFHGSIPWYLLLPAGACVTAWHFNLQHEAIHGWRSIPRALSAAVVWPPLGLWFPFEIYRRRHSIHHRNSQITYPDRDPESFYHARAEWARYPGWWRRILVANQSLAGRLLLGPWLRWRRLVVDDIGRLARGDLTDLAIWLRHFAGVALILWLVVGVAGMPLWQFLLFFVYGGMVLGMLRPFLEHRWGEHPYERVASVESNWFFGLLFLWNNLHIVHHLHPTMPWYEIPRFYRENRERLLALNGHYVYRGYWELARRYLLRPSFVPVHPSV